MLRSGPQLHGAASGNIPPDRSVQMPALSRIKSCFTGDVFWHANWCRLYWAEGDCGLLASLQYDVYFSKLIPGQSVPVNSIPGRAFLYNRQLVGSAALLAKALLWINTNYPNYVSNFCVQCPGYGCPLTLTQFIEWIPVKTSSAMHWPWTTGDADGFKLNCSERRKFVCAGVAICNESVSNEASHPAASANSVHFHGNSKQRSSSEPNW